MGHAVIGWEHDFPVPDGQRFNRYLQACNGRLTMDGLDLAQLFVDDAASSEVGRTFPSPLEIVYLPLIRRQIKFMRQVFADVIAELAYEGQFHYAYASKANAAEEVIRTTLGAGAHHEMSSTVDVDIARLMSARGLLTPERMVICNGFKPTGSDYATNITRLKAQHDNVIPVLEDLNELGTFVEARQHFDVGLRQKSYGAHQDLAEMDEANSRFGMHLDDIWKAADYIQAAPNLSLKLYHAMVGSQMVDREAFVSRLKPPMEIYARLRQRYSSLSIFNFGGGMPVAMTLDFEFDYHAFVRLFLETMQEVCGRYKVPVPDIMGEFGRYTSGEHGGHLFKIVDVKENNSDLSWYIIDGSVMSSFPDAWALGEHFIVLPLTNLDASFRQVQIGGITCDSDDVYPPKGSPSPLYLPADTDDLYIGFFGIGAYQEMLGGVRGSKHCVLPEAVELIVDRDADGALTFEVIPGQDTAAVLSNLGYQTT